MTDEASNSKPIEENVTLDRNNTQNHELNGHGQQNGDDAPDLPAEVPSTDDKINCCKTSKYNSLVHNVLQEVKNQRSTDIDLSHKTLLHVPHLMLEFFQLQHIYLAWNHIECLPEDFFDRLPNIVWLDLRYNELIHLPSSYIGSLQYLKNILLQGNQLKTLPLELGLVSSISGLNISDNPLEFPAQEIIDRGCNFVLQYFRNCLRCKSQGKAIPGVDDMSIGDVDGVSNSSDDRTNTQSGSLSHRRSYGTLSDSSRRTSVGEYDDLLPATASAGLHKQRSYNELRQQQQEKLRKAGALGMVPDKSVIKKPPNGKNGKKLKKLDQYPELPSQDAINRKFDEELKNAKRRQMLEKQDGILQKRKDTETLKQWHQDTKQKQQEKYRESYMYGGALERPDIAGKAPFGVDNKHMKVLSKEEQSAEDVRQKHERMRKALTPITKQRIEEAKRIREKELEEKIKQHTLSMQSRRGRSGGDPQQEMLTAKRDLEIAEQLHREISQRQKEYRLQAFTGDQ